MVWVMHKWKSMDKYQSTRCSFGHVTDTINIHSKTVWSRPCCVQWLLCSWYLWQISYASTSAALSDRSVFPIFFRTVPSDESLAPVLATVMQYYGWKQLSILTEGEPQFIKVFITSKLINYNFTFHTINTTCSFSNF